MLARSYEYKSAISNQQSEKQATVSLFVAALVVEQGEQLDRIARDEAKVKANVDTYVVPSCT